MPKLLQLHLLVALWSLTGILSQFINLEIGSLVFWRTTLATATLALILKLRRQPLLLPNNHLPLALVSGFLLGIHWLCFFGAIAVSNVSVGLAGFASTSLFTALLEPLFEKRRLRTREITLALLGGSGLLIIFGADTRVPNASLGIAIALLGALLAALYSLISRKLVLAQIPGPQIILTQLPASTLAALLTLPVLPFSPPAPTDWPWLLILSLACTVFAYLWYARLLQSLTAYTTNLAINFEPVYGILMAAALFHEHHSLTPQFYLGTLTILAANFLHSFKPQ
ncbi:MAG: DMT family transporter [Verrucomicrobiota bacterium]